MAIVFSRLLVYLAFFPTFSRTKYRHFWHGNQGNPYPRYTLRCEWSRFGGPREMKFTERSPPDEAGR